MTTVRILASVGDDQKGAVVAINDRRAQRLIRTGYAERVEDDKPKPKKPAKE